MTNQSFESLYKTIEDKVKFLKSFDLLNLQKAGKIGNISIKKMQKKDLAIKAILKFDFKNKFLICKNMFNNPEEYKKEKVDDNYIFKTLEWNQYQVENMKNDEWKEVREQLTSELNKYKEDKVNIAFNNEEDSYHDDDNFYKEDELTNEQINELKEIEEMFEENLEDAKGFEIIDSEGGFVEEDYLDDETSIFEVEEKKPYSSKTYTQTIDLNEIKPRRQNINNTNEIPLTINTTNFLNRQVKLQQKKISELLLEASNKIKEIDKKRYELIKETETKIKKEREAREAERRKKLERILSKSQKFHPQVGTMELKINDYKTNKNNDFCVSCPCHRLIACRACQSMQNKNWHQQAQFASHSNYQPSYNPYNNPYHQQQARYYQAQFQYSTTPTINYWTPPISPYFNYVPNKPFGVYDYQQHYNNTNNYFSRNYRIRGLLGAKREIDKLSSIEQFEIKDDYVNKRRILIIKGLIK